jgi:hypothetical protein
MTAGIDAAPVSERRKRRGRKRVDILVNILHITQFVSRSALIEDAMVAKAVAMSADFTLK